MKVNIFAIKKLQYHHTLCVVIPPPDISTPSPTATSVTITWTQPDFRLPVIGYTVTVTRVTGSGQVLCPSSVEEKQSTTTSPSVTTTTFTGLQEFSSYTVRVRFRVTASGIFSFANTATGSRIFTTLDAREFIGHISISNSIIAACIIIIIAPTRPPRDVTPSTTSRSVSVSWSTIECIERNGEITNYKVVVFQELGGAVIPGEVNVMDRTFTATGLTPHTNYTFRVAGVNSNGTGPYTNITAIHTDEDGMLYLTNASMKNVHVHVFLVLCLTSLVSPSSPP